MRFLFTTFRGSGHLGPLLPIADAVRAAGHDVVFACAASFVPTVERAGFPALAAGFDLRGRPLPELFPGARARPLVSQRLPEIFVPIFAGAMTPDLLSIGHEWRPDVIVRDAMEYGGCLAAEVLGIPHAVVRSSTPPSLYSWRRTVAEPLARLRIVNGLPPDPDVAMPFRYLYLAPEPPGFALPGDEDAPTIRRHRAQAADRAGDDGLPGWVADLPDRPTVYATLGTVVSREPSGQALFPTILAALRDEPINLVITVGRTNDPEQFGPQPASVHIARYIPQSLLLPHCDLLVSQGGFSTVTGALAAGLPMVTIPLMGDQPDNAARCAALGVGRTIGPEERTAEAIRGAMRGVLGDPTYRRNAERVREAMATLPGPEYAAELLERLAAEKRPILAA
ncbi:MAG: glycosyltransferase [Chloroflexota bacterium]|nr:glycosyltransferase [Chloroflexota bacterium]